MENLPEMATRIKALRGSKKQVEFAESLRVAQATVSSWESGQDTPAPLSCLLLGLLASGSERDWFFKNVGPDLETMMAAADAILKERSAPPLEGEIIRVSCVKKTAQGIEDTGALYPVAAKSVPNPGSTEAIVIDESAASLCVPSGSILLLDKSRNNLEGLLSPFRDGIVALDREPSMVSSAMPPEAWSGGQAGVLIGKLRFKHYLSVNHTVPGNVSYSHIWVVTVGSFGDYQTEWEPRDEAVCVGSWAPIRQGQVTGPRGWNPPEKAVPFSEAEMMSEMRLYRGYRILGICVGWFRPPATKAEK
jgi:transcriptional regulator with XRE-family HTH domain